MKIIYFLSACFLLLLLLGCNTIDDEITQVVSDSTDTEGFYTLSSNSFILKYKVVNHQFLQCRLSGNGTGWVAVGFDAQDLMLDVNFIIGAVVGGNGIIRDDFGTSQTSHASDTSLGGTNDVTLVNALEVSDKITIEFLIPLVSGDSKDRPLVIGNTYNVLFARGADDDFGNIHTTVGTGLIRIRE